MRILIVLCVLVMALAGCISPQAYDPQSVKHAEQAHRNVGTDLNNGHTEAEVDAFIAEAWAIAGVEGEPSPEFVAKLKSYAVPDETIRITTDQAAAWIEYELSKKPVE